MAPLHLRKGLLKLIDDRDAATPRRASPRGIRIKVNSIVDEAIIDALYRASQAGRARRGVGARHLRAEARASPGSARTSGCARSSAATSSTRGSSRSHNDGDPQVYIGSADMMHRNLDRRVEALVRLVDPAHLAEIGGLFDQAMGDRRPARGGSGPTASGSRHSTRRADGSRSIDMQNAHDAADRASATRAGRRR